MHNSLITAVELKDWLSTLTHSEDEHSKQPTNLKILFTSMQSAPTERPEIVKQHPNTYIPNSIYFDFQNNFAQPNATFSNTMPQIELFELKARELGLNNEDHIVVYDDFGNFCASRAWFMFRAVGFENIKVLDGGLPLWLNSKFPTQNSLINTVSVGNFKASKQTDFYFIDKESVLENLNTHKSVVLDARSKGRFSGREKENKPNLRSGHIPSSKNLHYAELFNEQGQFLTIEELQKKYEPFGNELIFSCGSGVTACILAHAAYMLGTTPLKVYDGSWSEWGLGDTFPIEQGE